MSDITDTLAPKTDQLDSIELADGPRTFTVDHVVVNVGAEQPVNVHFVEFPRPWRPGVTMRRVLGHYWSNNSSTWAGRRVRLFRDPDVTFGPGKPGGTRISHMSDLLTTTPAPILLSQGRAGTYKVDPLPDATPARNWDAVLATAAGLTDVAELGDLWKREQMGSAPESIRATFVARVEAIKAATAEVVEGDGAGS